MRLGTAYRIPGETSHASQPRTPAWRRPRACAKGTDRPSAVSPNREGSATRPASHGRVLDALPEGGMACATPTTSACLQHERAAGAGGEGASGLTTHSPYPRRQEGAGLRPCPRSLGPTSSSMGAATPTSTTPASSSQGDDFRARTHRPREARRQRYPRRRSLAFPSGRTPRQDGPQRGAAVTCPRVRFVRELWSQPLPGWRALASRDAQRSALRRRPRPVRHRSPASR